MTTKIASTDIQASALDQLIVPKLVSATVGSATATATAGGEQVTVTGAEFNAGAIVYIDNVSTTTTFISSTSVSFIAPAKTAGTYNLYVYNTDGTTAAKPGGIIYFDPPVFSTAAGALSTLTLNVAYSTTIAATGGTITYSLVSGSLPTGLTLNSSSGVISGTVTSGSGSFTFTIAATNQYNQRVTREFSIVLVLTSSLEYLIVAGGGGGGVGGGGGAGGFRTASNMTVGYATTYAVTVGSGGPPAYLAGALINSNCNGNDSSFNGITSTGGGAGATSFTGNGGGATAANGTTYKGANGGSGGGSGGNSDTGSTTVPGGTGIAGQGNNGGSGAGIGGSPSGGGGGASAAGGNAGGSIAGGAGTSSSITGSAVTYAGGGGGGSFNTTTGAGGAGGGGNGTNGGTTAGSGTANTGGGGGGNSGGGSSGSGGSGIVVIRYSDSLPAASSTTGSPTYTVAGGFRVYSFTGNGSITW